MHTILSKYDIINPRHACAARASGLLRQYPLKSIPETATSAAAQLRMRFCAACASLVSNT